MSNKKIHDMWQLMLPNLTSTTTSVLQIYQKKALNTYGKGVEVSRAL